MSVYQCEFLEKGGNYFMSRKKKLLFIFITLSIISLSLIVYYSTSKQTAKNRDLQHHTSFMTDESVVYLGDELVKKEMLFIFDYSCIWCSRWMDEIFPHINKLVEEKKVKFRTQSMVFLNSASLELSMFDQNIKEYYPDKYFDIFSQLINDGLVTDLEQLLTGSYLDDIITTYQLDDSIMRAEPNIDVINLTRKYTNGLNIESVPTLVVDGVKVEDPFDIIEIERLIK